MAITSLLEIDLKQILSYIKRTCKVKLPQRVVEVSLAEKYSLLHIRFREPRKHELGEPLHPLIHIYRDSETKEITALEIIDLNTLLAELRDKSCNTSQ